MPFETRIQNFLPKQTCGKLYLLHAVVETMHIGMQVGDFAACDMQLLFMSIDPVHTYAWVQIVNMMQWRWEMTSMARSVFERDA